MAFGFFGEPFDDTTPNDMTVAPFSNAVGDVITGKWDAAEGHNTTLTEQLAGDNLEHFRLFVDFRTIQFPRGEIRGILQEVVPTPEAATLPILGLAFGLDGRPNTPVPLAEALEDRHRLWRARAVRHLCCVWMPGPHLSMRGIQITQ